MKIKDRLAKLIEVKSLITLMFSVCLSIAFLMGKVDVKDYITVCMTGLTFFLVIRIAKRIMRKENKYGRFINSLFAE